MNGNTTDSVEGSQSVLTEAEANEILDRLADEPKNLALRRIIPDPSYSERRHEFVAFDGDWHSGSMTETQRGCVLSEWYKHRSGLTGVPKEQIDIVPYEQTPFPYWTADLITLQCPNCPDVRRSVNELLLPRYENNNCAECGAEVVVDVE